MASTKLIRVSEAAFRLDCSPRTVWQLIAQGKLTRIRIGPRSTRIDEAELQSFIRQARVGSGD